MTTILYSLALWILKKVAKIDSELVDLLSVGVLVALLVDSFATILLFLSWQTC